MENHVIYTHYPNFDKVIEIVQTMLPKAKIEYNDGGLQKSLVATIKNGFFSKSKTLKINYRQRQTPSYNLENINCGLSQNLAGMVNWVQSFPAQNEALQHKFLIKIMAVNAEMPFMVESGMDDTFEAVLCRIAQELEAFIFASPSPRFNQSNTQHFLDKNLKLIIDQGGHSEITDIDVMVDAKYQDAPEESYTPDQIERKTRSIAELQEKGVKISQTLPCVEAEAQTKIRSKAEIIDRVYALFVTAAKGEGIKQNHLQGLVDAKQVKNLSPKEQAFFENPAPSQMESSNATWRYESLNTVLWVLGFVPELTFPNDMCQVPALIELIMKPSRAEFEAQAKPRSIAEILDALDKTYRMNWACVDAAIKNETVSGELHPSVIYERHYALNWLTFADAADWDEVRTHT